MISKSNVKIDLSKAVLVGLSVGLPAFNKRDVETSKWLAEQKGIKNPAMARAWKSLFEKNDYLDAITSIVRAARNFHYENTFAWLVDGPRILTTDNYMPYMDYMRVKKAEFYRAVPPFLDHLDLLKEEAAKSLNSMYNERDYPSRQLLERRFSMDIVRMPIPDATQIVADVGDAEREQIRADLEESMQEAFRNANRDLWERLYSTINRVSERLSKPKSAREESLTSLREMLSLLERLNVTGDERLETLRKQTEARLNGMSLSDLKNDEAKRKVALEETDRIVAAMSAMMGGTANAA